MLYARQIDHKPFVRHPANVAVTGIKHFKNLARQNS